MPGALLHDSGAPSMQLCPSSDLCVWPGQLCVVLGFWSAAGGVAAPSGTAAGVCVPFPCLSGFSAAGTCWPLPGRLVAAAAGSRSPLPGSSGATATGACGPVPGCSVTAAAGLHEPLPVTLVTLYWGDSALVERGISQHFET